MTDVAADHLVHEAEGPAFTPLQAGAVIAVGVISLLISGLLPLLLGALAEAHRLTASGIGQTAMAEAFSTAIVTGLAGALLKPERLRLITIVTALLIAGLNFATCYVSGAALMGVRLLAGVPEGVMLWVTVGMIARTATPERWAGALFTSLTIAQLAFAAAFAAVVLPRFGANGGYVAVGLAMLPAVPLAFLIPPRYGPLSQAAGTRGAPPLKGWIALAATLLLMAGATGVGVYLVPLARQAGLNAGVAGAALSVSLLCQVVGAGLATAIAGKVRYVVVFTLTTLAFLVVWTVYAFSVPAWLFVGATALGGVAILMMGPFFVPLTIEADPTRRAAMQSGAAQLLGGGLGPLLASLVVGEHDAHGALVFGAVLLLIGFSILVGLHRAARRQRSIT